jgi:hypothetical protein
VLARTEGTSERSSGGKHHTPNRTASFGTQRENRREGDEEARAPAVDGNGIGVPFRDGVGEGVNAGEVGIGVEGERVNRGLSKSDSP